MKTKLKVVRYLENDVVATSGISKIEPPLLGCPKTGMSSTSYMFEGDNGCTWMLNFAEIDPLNKGEQEGDSDFIYFNENGIKTTVGNDNVESLNGIYFHFDGNGNFEICTKSNHHCTYVPEPQ